MDFEPIRYYTGIAQAITDLPSAFALDPYNRRQTVQLEEIDKILEREKAKTIYREEYVDRHFIHDFCGHYGSCFQDYPKKCIRLHFFTKRFTLSQFKATLALCANSYDWRERLGEYVGFIVLRPIPQAIFGNVSLKAAADTVENHYLRKMVNAHLCGLELEVTTIPFQEQDNAISACATSALWMALQAQAHHSGDHIPSPHRLTTNARKVTEEGIQSHKVNKGLTISQMARAVKEENFEPLVCVPHSTSYAKALLKAYLSAGFPVVLGINLYYRSDTQSSGALSRVIGNHAVTVLGWKEGVVLNEFDSPDLSDDSMRQDDENKMQSEEAIPSEEREAVARLYLESSYIDAIYCHDDQIGPYSLISFPDEYSLGMTTEWTRLHQQGPVDAKIATLLVPCHPKVRIRFSDIYENVKAMNNLFFPFYNMLGTLTSWDIRLETVNELKEKILKDTISLMDQDTKYALLSMPLPRFIWVVDQYIYTNGEGADGNYSPYIAATYLFDATDIQNSDYLINAIHFTEAVYRSNQSYSMMHTQEKGLNDMPFIIRRLIERYAEDSKERMTIV